MNGKYCPTGYGWTAVVALSFVAFVGSVAIAADWWGRVYGR